MKQSEQQGKGVLMKGLFEELNIKQLEKTLEKRLDFETSVVKLKTTSIAEDPIVLTGIGSDVGVRSVQKELPLLQVVY